MTKYTVTSTQYDQVIKLYRPASFVIEADYFEIIEQGSILLFMTEVGTCIAAFSDWDRVVSEEVNMTEPYEPAHAAEEETSTEETSAEETAEETTEETDDAA